MLSNHRYQGRHRAPSTTGRTAAKVAAAGAVAALPMVAAPAAHAGPPGGWGAIIECESGGDPRAQNPSSSASGLFQFIDSTWRGLGGSGSAKDASVDEQYRMAEKLYAQSGTSPWNASKSCWAGKSVPEPPKPAPKPAPAPKAAAPAGDYTVKAGDTLSAIAAAHGTTWQKVFAANRDVIENPDLIYVGEHLKL